MDLKNIDLQTFAIGLLGSLTEICDYKINLDSQSDELELALQIIESGNSIEIITPDGSTASVSLDIIRERLEELSYDDGFLNELEDAYVNENQISLAYVSNKILMCN